jgi:ribosome-associated translation inhibitor RaiA
VDHSSRQAAAPACETAGAWSAQSRGGTETRLFHAALALVVLTDAKESSDSQTRNLMQILLHSHPSIDGSLLMTDHLTTVVNDAMGHFGERLTRVEAHLSDVNSHAKSGNHDIHCTLEARLVGLDAIVVKDHAGSAHQAIEGAVRKLRRAVGAEIAKHDPRSHRVPLEVPRPDDRVGVPD